MESYSGLANQGFDFDQFRCKSPPITTENVQERAEVLLELAYQWYGYTNVTSANTIMIPWGGDFRWQNGSYQYGNMSLIMDHVNQHYRNVTIQYATVSEYAQILASKTPDETDFAEYRGTFEPYDYRAVDDTPHHVEGSV